MFDKLFKTKPYLIYLFTILVVLVIIYFGYPYLVKKDGFTANDDKDDDKDDEDDKKEGFTADDEDDEDDKPVENMRDSGMVNGDQAYKKNKISSIVPFPAASSVGPTNPGVSVDDYVENFNDKSSESKNNVKTYNF